mmetsp:Transcript_21030/g.32967  ORF Transcript_21030/g.32967 Transcript_21030/m.32967 type:complete len:82 (+) Transcript_21030:171-416(+)
MLWLPLRELLNWSREGCSVSPKGLEYWKVVVPQVVSNGTNGKGTVGNPAIMMAMLLHQKRKYEMFCFKPLLFANDDFRCSC